MTRKPLLALALLLAAAAVLLHLPALDAPPSAPDFAQGAYRPLLRAEHDLAGGRTEEALSSFQLAAMRAIHVGRLDVYDRIRLRLGHAGKTLAAARLSAGWPYLSRFVLWANAFDPNARLVENWVLASVPNDGRFAYPVVLASGRTVWGDRPERLAVRVPLEVMAHEREETLGQMGWQFPADALRAGSRWVFLYPIRWRQVTGDGDLALTLSGPGASRWRWYVKPWGKEEWKGPMVADAPFPLKGDWSLVTLCAAGSGRPKFVELDLVRTYRPL